MGRASLAENATLLGKYRIEKVLGRGGMGVVVQARHMSLDEVVAIKVLSDEIGVTDETFERFGREAQAAARLKSPHVVDVIDVGRLEDGLPYMVMELLHGDDLNDLKKAGKVDEALAVTAVLQTCEVLAEAHSLGIVHRDIKPSNLFITRSHDGRPFTKVLDFGIAKVSDVRAAPITRTQSMLGTPAYMSPEQLRSSRSVDARTDIWALGVVLYELLEGKRPFDSEGLPELVMAIAMREPPPPKRIRAPLVPIVMRCLDKDPARRFQSAEELAEALIPFSIDPQRARHSAARMAVLVQSSSERIDEPVPFAMSAPRGRLEATADVRAPNLANLAMHSTVGVAGSDGLTAAARPGLIGRSAATTPASYSERPSHESLTTVDRPPARPSDAEALRMSAAVTAAREVPQLAPLSTSAPRRRWGTVMIAAVLALGTGGVLAAKLVSDRDAETTSTSAAPVASEPPTAASGSAATATPPVAADTTTPPAESPPPAAGATVPVAAGSATGGAVAAGSAVAPQPPAAGSADVTGVEAQAPEEVAATTTPPAEPPKRQPGRTGAPKGGGRRQPGRSPTGTNAAPAQTGSTTTPNTGSAAPCDPFKSRFGC